MTYLSYFGFDTEPFGHAAQGRLFYAGPQHHHVMRRLLHCVESMQGLAVLIGDIGCGKTTLARRMLEALPPQDYVAVLVVVVHKDVGPLWLVRHIAQQLGVVEPASTSSAVLAQLVAHLEALRTRGKRAVVLVDEAQMLQSRELMEEFRGMLNLEVAEAKLLSFVFFGLPELEEVLALDPPLAQRVAMRCQLRSLDAPMVADYIAHRLSVVSRAPQQIFSADAIAAIYRYSQGVPRIINTLCDNVLLEIFLAGERVAEASLVASVAQNLNLVLRLQAAAPMSAPAEAGVTSSPSRPRAEAALPPQPLSTAPQQAPAAAPSGGEENWGRLKAVGNLLSNRGVASTEPVAASRPGEPLRTQLEEPPAPAHAMPLVRAFGSPSSQPPVGDAPTAPLPPWHAISIDRAKVDALLHKLNNL